MCWRVDFTPWSCGDKFCGMFETISAYDEQPRIDWYWGIRLAGNGKWVVDYPPVLMTELCCATQGADPGA